jgi:PhzF family phenazine biosynthesis protein
VSKPIPIYQVDAFVAEHEFSGNPAGVCITPSDPDDSWMQNVAMEMNLSETAFLVQEGEEYRLRWFSPTVEVALCGHATLASSHVLWEEGFLPKNRQARFRTKSGLLTADRKGERIDLNLPATADETVAPMPELEAALAVHPLYTGKNAFDYIIEVESERIIAGLKPDFNELRKLGVRGVIVTSKASTPGVDFVSRFFAPGAGIDEDPVTGSAHACLGPYWMKRLGKNEFVARQISKRGGIVNVRVEGNRVVLGGKARIFFKGSLTGT